MKADRGRLRRFCTFRAAGLACALDILEVQEVMEGADIAPVPHAPPQVRGLVNVRGRIFLVLDPAGVLGAEDRPGPEAPMLVLLKPDVATDLAILADSVGDVLLLPEEEVGPDGEREPGPRLGRLRTASGDFILLDGRALLPSPGHPGRED